MGTDTRYLIIGGGLAAARAVEGIRELDDTGPVTVLTREPHLPYERPPLSKGVLLESEEPAVTIPHDDAWYAKQHVVVRTSTPVDAIDPDGHTVALAGGEELGWDRLLLATGSVARALDVPGADLPGVAYLRTTDESLKLLERLRQAGSVVVIGAGWIGLEVAAAAREHGCTVTVVEPQPAPLLAVMGQQVGEWFADLHRSHGVDVRLGAGVTRIAGGEDGVTGVELDDGSVVPADTVVIGVGIRPEVGLAEAAGARVDNGVVTDASLRTSLADIWAAGDVANWPSGLYGTNLRVEHWANARDGGFDAGRAMAGAEVTYDPVPYFFSDQYDVGLEYAGYVPRDAGAEVVWRGAPASNEFMVFWVVPDGDRVRVLAGMHVNTWDAIDAVQALIRSGQTVARDRLADPEVPLDELV